MTIKSCKISITLADKVSAIIRENRLEGQLREIYWSQAEIFADTICALVEECVPDIAIDQTGFIFGSSGNVEAGITLAFQLDNDNVTVLNTINNFISKVINAGDLFVDENKPLGLENEDLENIVEKHSNKLLAKYGGRDIKHPITIQGDRLNRCIQGKFSEMPRALTKKYSSIIFQGVVTGILKLERELHLIDKDGVKLITLFDLQLFFNNVYEALESKVIQDFIIQPVANEKGVIKNTLLEIKEIPPKIS